MKRLITLAAMVAVLTLTGAGVALAAIPDGAIPVPNACDKELYVPGDEGSLLPEQKPGGLLFDGPSIVHRQVTPLALADVPPGHLTTVGDVTGDKPLFKMETSAPYSTINVTGSGLFWSSKIDASAPGGQSHPVEHASELAKLAPYTEATKVVTIGAGYANDQGNSATVSSITWNGHTYDLTCAPPTSASPKPSDTTATPKPSTSSSAVAGAVSTTEPPSSAAGGLPVTGTDAVGIVAIGGLLLLGGVGAFVISRRRKTRWES